MARKSARAATPDPSSVRPTTPNASAQAAAAASTTLDTTAASTPAPKPAPSAQLSSSASVWEIGQSALNKYQTTTPQRTKLIDVFMVFLMVVGALQMLYCVIVGNYPFNAFLAGFCATVGQFVLTASLRIQTNPDNKAEFSTVSPERAFGDFIFGSIILHFICVHFIN